METIKHTPTPWGIDNVSLALIPPMRKIGYSKETSQANAAFIVRAVNSHDELLKNLIRLSEILHAQNRPTYKPEKGVIESYLKDADNAIAKAEGR